MRLIDADALMHIYTAETKHCADIKSPAKRGWQGACQLLYDAPAIDAVPVVHGRWILTDNGIRENFNTGEAIRTYLYDCPLCGYHTGNQGKNFNFCTNCGTRMDLEAQHVDKR